MTSLLFVCMGNICRSPAAEGMMRHLVKDDEFLSAIEIQSCGLGDWHVGKLPDERMREAAQNRGLALVSRAQKISTSFFDHFDLILAADNTVLHQLHQYAVTPEHKAKIHLITHFSSRFPEKEIPDPYYEEMGFENVLDMIEDSCHGILDHLKQNHK